MTTPASMTAPKHSGPLVRQFQLGAGRHDGTQYNFFAGGKVFSVRVIASQAVHHHSAWIFDGGVREVVNSDVPMDRVGSDHLDVEAACFKLRSGRRAGPDERLRRRFRAGVPDRLQHPPVTFDWSTPGGGAVIHQPLIRADIAYRGETCTGIGYCKRFWFHEDTDYLAWRFIEGETGGGQSMLWTADGNFGGDYRKYDYFKIAYPDGRLMQAADIDSRHRDDAAYATIDGVPFEVRIEGLGTWSTVLRGNETQLMLRQRFCKMTVHHEGRIEEG